MYFGDSWCPKRKVRRFWPLEHRLFPSGGANSSILFIYVSLLNDPIGLKIIFKVSPNNLCDFMLPEPGHKKLDYQVSICSLIPPATAISKTQDRVDTSVWWKLPFSIFFIIYHVQSTIINKVCKPELWFLCSTHPIIVLYICMKFHENISNNF